jgi:hypothetical protein
MCSLGVGSAQAFSVQDKDAANAFGPPKFDLEEQSKNFRTGTTGSVGQPGMPKYEFETFLGKGSLEFGLQPNPSYFGSPLGPSYAPGLGLGPAPRNSREDFNRVITPDSLR